MDHTNIIDYYKLFDLDRKASSDEIKKEIRGKMKIWQERKVTTKDEQIRQMVQTTIENLTNASMTLGFSAKRKAYDKELEEAYKAGFINDIKQAEAKDALELARQYYVEGKPQLAVQHALEAIENNVGISDAHEILAHSYYELGEYEKALETVDQANELYKNNIDFEWLKIRFNINLERFDVAQAQINATLNRSSTNSLIHAEQAYLYYCSGRKSMALDEIDNYLAKNIGDEEYKKFAANNLITCSQALYLVDPSAGGLVLTEGEAYIECLMLCEKAYSLWKNDVTQKELDDVRAFGVTEFDNRNIGKIAFIGIEILAALFVLYIVAGIELKLLLGAVSIFLVCFDIVLLKTSMRPLWAILKESYTGARSRKESILISIADFLCFPLEAFRDMF